jgi:hypothetical protein
MAVGGDDALQPPGYFARQPLAEWWDGNSWSIENMPAPVGAAATHLSGVSCSSGSACSAVGWYATSGFDGGFLPPEPFAEHWNGRIWSLDPTPPIMGAELAGVSCTSPTTCVAVGDYDNLPSPISALAERWDGSRWSVLRTPEVAGGWDELFGVSCTSSSICTAVGSSGLRERPLVERWDGTSWLREKLRGLVPAGSLEAVSCTSSLSCTAVGNSVNGVVAAQSAPASATLTGMPAACASARFTIRVIGNAISSVAWSLDGRKITGRTRHRGIRYDASITLSPGRHKLEVRVDFVASSHTSPRAFRRTVLGCSPGG